MIKILISWIRHSSLCLTVVFGVVFVANLNQATAQDRPNILYIMTDQHQAQALSCAGNPDLNTPNLDRLSGNGMRFTKAYVTFPLCTPSRSSMITGKMPHQLGIYSNKDGNNEMPEAERLKGLGHLMSNAGYDCAYGGKWHVHTAAMTAGNGFQKIAGFGDIGLAEKCIEFLENGRQPDKPFFLVASFDNPHNICEWARSQPLPYGDIPPAPVELCPALPANFARVPDEPEVIRLEQQFMPRLYPTRNYQEEDWRQYRNAYYRLVEKVDAEIGKILTALQAFGLAENTLVIFSSDHGDGNAAHGWNQKTVLYEESIKVPLIVQYPGRIRPGTVNDELVSTGLDLLPTLADYAGAEIPPDLAGKSWRPLLDNPAEPWQRDYLVIETMFDGPTALQTMGRAVVSKQYKYVLYGWGKFREQLYDLENDPGEMKNLAMDPAYQKHLNEYRHILFQWCKSTNDNKFLRRVKLPEGAGSSSQLFDKAH